MKVGKHAIKEILVVILFLFCLGAGVFAHYVWVTFITTELEVGEPLELLSCPSVLNLFPDVRETFTVTVENHAAENYNMMLEFSLDNTTYQEKYVTFSNDLYVVESGRKNLTAWARPESNAPSTNAPLTVKLVRDAYPTGLVAYWKFDEGAGDMAYDSSGNNNTGIICSGRSRTRGLWVDGRYGKALRFDGKDDYIEIPNSPSLDFDEVDRFTLEAWIYSEVPQEGVSRPIIDKDNSCRLFFDYPNPKFRGAHHYWERPNGPNCWVSKGYVNLTDGAWNHYVAVFNRGSTGKGDSQLYVNGKRVVTKWRYSYYYADSDLNPSNMIIGSSQGLTNWFKGIIDEVRIYRFPLTEDEVKTRFAGGEIPNQPRPCIVSESAGIICIENGGASGWIIIHEFEMHCMQTFRRFIKSGELLTIEFEEQYCPPCECGRYHGGSEPTRIKLDPNFT